MHEKTLLGLGFTNKELIWILSGFIVPVAFVYLALLIQANHNLGLQNLSDMMIINPTEVGFDFTSLLIAVVYCLVGGVIVTLAQLVNSRKSY